MLEVLGVFVLNGQTPEHLSFFISAFGLEFQIVSILDAAFKAANAVHNLLKYFVTEKNVAPVHFS